MELDRILSQQKFNIRENMICLKPDFVIKKFSDSKVEIGRKKHKCLENESDSQLC